VQFGERDVSEEHIASSACSAFADLSLGVLFGPDYIGNMFFTKVVLAPDCTALQPRRQYSLNICMFAAWTRFYTRSLWMRLFLNGF
jgi:hypothetical protein